jgi:hypothetical protein
VSEFYFIPEREFHEDGVFISLLAQQVISSKNFTVGAIHESPEKHLIHRFRGPPSPRGRLIKI